MTATAKRRKTAKPLRVRVLGALHSEGAKRGLSHIDLRECAGCESLAALSDEQLLAAFEALTGKRFRVWHPGIRSKERRQAAGTAGHKGTKETVAHLVSPDDMRMLYDAAYSKLGWDHERLRGFIRRQLGGRDQIRTLADFNKVWWPLKRMAKAARGAA